MGDPKKSKKQYQTPSHPFRKERIDTERVLKKEYGLKNKTELWKVQSTLKSFTRQAKRLIATKTEQSEKERKQILARLAGLGLTSSSAELGDILNITIENVLARRLQTIVHKKQLARSVTQSRQFIVHGHILVAGKKITSPSYLVHSDEESTITFVANSTLASPDHPERSIAAAKATPADPKGETA